jgi:hypothetical protein
MGDAGSGQDPKQDRAKVSPHAGQGAGRSQPLGLRPFRSAPPAMIVGEKPPERGTAEAVRIPAMKPTTRAEATTNASCAPSEWI